MIFWYLFYMYLRAHEISILTNRSYFRVDTAYIYGSLAKAFAAHMHKVLKQTNVQSKFQISSP